MPEHPGGDHVDNGICLLGPKYEALVVCFSLDYKSFRVAPEGNWSEEKVVVEVSYILLGNPWKAQYNNVLNRFTHTPLSSVGDPHDDEWWEYMTWDGGLWKCRAGYGAGPHQFQHFHLDDSALPILQKPPGAKCQFVTYG